MYCPKCHRSQPADAKQCSHCDASFGHVADRLYIGRQFIFVEADPEHPVALRVDDAVQTYQARAIFSRHIHSIGFGDVGASDVETLAGSWSPWSSKLGFLPDLPALRLPALHLTAVVTDRKIYKPGGDAALFIIAPDAGGQTAGLEVRLAGQKVYEAKVPLNADGLALHRYADLREGEFTAVVTFAGRPGAIAECAFSVAEFTLSPLIATLADHRVVKQLLRVSLKILLLSQPYTGPAEVRLHCPVCAGLPPPSGLDRLEEVARRRGFMPYQDYGARVSRPVTVDVCDGRAQAEFTLCHHDGPFRIEVVTPQGHTAQVALPNLGETEREKICINPLGQTVEASLAPWPASQPVRGLYLGPGEVAAAPLGLASACANRGELRAWADIPLAQLATFDPRSGQSAITEARSLGRDDVLTFDVGSPYTIFTVGAFMKGAPFEGWGVVIKPTACEATLTAPATAAPGAEIEVFIEPEPNAATGRPAGLFCWLLAYDARLEHESPLPKLGKRIYEGVKGAVGAMKAQKALPARPRSWELWQTLAAVNERLQGGPQIRSMTRFMVDDIRGAPRGLPVMAKAPSAIRETEVAEPEAAAVEMVLTTARMEFPELVHNELFYCEGAAARTIRLGDQIGAWRVRAYLFSGADCRELTADVQAEKPTYVELDLPAIASDGDEIVASAQYQTAEPAEMVIATPFGETRATVQSHGAQHFTVKGPGRVEVRLEGAAGADWTVREISPPGIQRVIASRLMILRRGETAAGERVAVYAAAAPVLADTIAALLAYPFG